MRPKAAKKFCLTFFRNISRILGGQLKIISPLLPLPFPIFPSLCFFPSPCLLPFPLSTSLPQLLFPCLDILPFPLAASLPHLSFPFSLPFPFSPSLPLPLKSFPSLDFIPPPPRGGTEIKGGEGFQGKGKGRRGRK